MKCHTFVLTAKKRPYTAQMSSDSNIDSNLWFWILGCLFTLLTVAGNGLVAYLILKKPQLQTKPNCFIASLAVADIFVGITYFPQILVKSFICHSQQCDDVFFITRHFFQYSSNVNLCIMLVDRHISVTKPLKHVTLMTTKRVTILLIASWTAPLFIFAIPQSIFLLFATEDQENAFSIFKTLVFSTLPMILLIALTTSVLAVARSLSHEARALNAQVRFNHRNDTLELNASDSPAFERQRTAKMMIFVMVIFILCSAGENWKGFCSCDWSLCCDEPKNVDHVLNLVCLLNSAANPIAYSFLKKDFKEQLKRLFQNRH